MIKVYIIDDHQLFIDGLKAIMSDVDGLKVIGSSLNPRDGVKECVLLESDVVLMDINMPELSGIDATQMLKSLNGDIKVLTVSMHNDIAHIDMMINAGASGYILKNTGREELEEAIKSVRAGQIYYSKDVQQAILNQYTKEKVDVKSNSKPKLDDTLYFTRREKEVMRLIVNGFSNTEMAEFLGLSYHTVTTHKKNIYSKTNTNNIATFLNYLKENPQIDF